MKVVAQVFEETNYDAFKRLSDNRDVTQGRIAKLIASISEKYILNPIIVNEKMEIIDGQGRYDALKTLNKPIHFIISPGATSEDCRRMNKYNAKWTCLDFAKSHAKSGNQNYVRLLLACKNSSLPIGQILRITNKGTAQLKDSPAMSNFESGKLIFTEKDVETVSTVKKATDEISEALQFNGRTNDAYIIAIKVMIETEGYDHKRMINHCILCRRTYAQMASLKDQLSEFDRIYNYKTSTKKRLYFSDYMRNRGSNVREYNSPHFSAYNQPDASSLKGIAETN